MPYLWAGSWVGVVVRKFSWGFHMWDIFRLKWEVPELLPELWDWRVTEDLVQVGDRRGCMWQWENFLSGRSFAHDLVLDYKERKQNKGRCMLMSERPVWSVLNQKWGVLRAVLWSDQHSCLTVRYWWGKDFSAVPFHKEQLISSGVKNTVVCGFNLIIVIC